MSHIVLVFSNNDGGKQGMFERKPQLFNQLERGKALTMSSAPAEVVMYARANRLIYCNEERS